MSCLQDTEGVGLPFAMFFSLLASMAMQGIFSVRMQVEDPFDVDVYQTDRIDIRTEFESVRSLLEGRRPSLAPVRKEEPAPGATGTDICTTAPATHSGRIETTI